MTPQQASLRKVELSVEYARLSERLEKILEVRPSTWLEIRKTAKSAKDADRTYEASQLGIEEMKLKMQMDRTEKEISALNSFLRVSELEARNMI